MNANLEVLKKFIDSQKQRLQDDISKQGYKDDSPYRNNPSNTIYGTPQGTPITMKGVSTPLIGMDEFGNKQYMQPGQEYQFPGSQVTETRVAKYGGLLNKTIKCSNCGWSWKAADGGNDVSTCHKCGNQNIMQTGGQKKPLYVESKNHPRYRAYQDSLVLSNLTERQKPFMHRIINGSNLTESQIQHLIISETPDFTEKELKARDRLKANPVKITPYNYITRDNSRMSGTWSQWKKPQQQVIVKPKEKLVPLQPMSVGLQDVDNGFQTNLDIPTPVQRQPKYYDVRDVNNQNFGGTDTQYRVDSLDELRELPKEQWDRKITPHYQMGGTGMIYANRDYQVGRLAKAQVGQQIKIRNKNGEVVTMDTNSPEYRSLYQQGLIQSSNAGEGDIPYFGGTLEEVKANSKLSPFAKSKGHYDKEHGRENFINQKKDEYIKNLGSNWYGADRNNFPEQVLKEINQNYDYNRNTYALEQLAKKEKFDLNKRGAWVDKLTPSQRESLINSKYSSQLNPSEFSNTLSGLQELVNTGYVGRPLNFNIPGLTPREQKEDAESKLSGLKALSFINLPGNYIANAAKNSTTSSYGDFRDVPMFGSQRMGNVSEMESVALNPINYEAIASLPKLASSGYKFLKNSPEMTKALLNEKVLPFGKSNLPKNLNVEYVPPRAKIEGVNDLYGETALGDVILKDAEGLEYGRLRMQKSDNGKFAKVGQIDVDPSIRGNRAQDVLYQKAIQQAQELGFPGIQSGESLEMPGITKKLHDRFKYIDTGKFGDSDVTIKTLTSHKNENIIPEWEEFYRNMKKPREDISIKDAFNIAGKKLGTEEGLLSNAYKYNPFAETLNDANKSYRVAGLNAFEDFKNTGVLRSRNTEPGQLVEGTNFVLPPRPTSFPSFQKGYADMAYAKPEGSVVFETALPTFKRGEINPVTGLPIKGRHYAHRVINPKTGGAMAEIPAADIRVFGDKPHWLKGYQQLEVPTLSTSTVENTANVTKNLEDLTYAKNWAKKYGYDLPQNFERIAQSNLLTDRTIRGLANRHNTFVRGVSTNWEHLAQKNPQILKYLEQQGFNLATEEGSKQAAEYMATHIPMNTGYGRFGLKQGEDALYLSNSVPTAEGYTYGNGYIVKAKRPTDFSSANRNEWLTNNDFDAHLGFKGSPFGKGVVKNDYIKRFPTNFRETLAITGDPNKMVELQKAVKEKELIYNDLAHQSWRKYNDKIDLLKYKTDPVYRTKFIMDDAEDRFFLRNSPNILDKIHFKYLKTKKDLDQTYYNTLPLVDIAKGIYGDVDVWKAFGKNLFGKLDPFSHYAIKGKEGEKVLETLKSIKVNPQGWQNTSRAHINKYTNKLTRREDGGSIEPKQNYIPSWLE